MALSRQVVGSNRKESSITLGNINIEDLSHQAEKVGFGPELKDIIEKINKIHLDLKKKNLELSLLEIIAMESVDENISELRLQLFTAVRLIHGDEILKILNDENQVSRLSRFNDGGLLPEAKSHRSLSQEQIMQNGIIKRFQKYFQEYRQLRAEVRELKKSWKLKKSMDEQYDMGCDSGG